jgi:PAS domain S-box-containing protein
MLDRLDLKSRIALTATAVCLVATWLTFDHTVHVLRRDMERQVTVDQTNDLAVVAGSIDYVIGLRIAALEALSQDLSRSALPDRLALQRRLEEHRDLTSLFRFGISVQSADGQVLADFPPIHGRRGGNLGQRRSFQEALTTGKASFGEPRIGDFSREPIIAVAVPVRAADGRVIGTLHGVMGLVGDGLVDLSQDGNQPGRELHLVSARDSVTLAATDPARTLQPIPEAFARLIAPELAGQGRETRPVMLEGRQVLLAARALEAAPWTLVSTVPVSRALAPLASLQQKILVFALVLSVVLVGCIWLLTRQLLQPLDRLGAELASAQPDLPSVKLDGPQELSRLAGSFNRLMDLVRRQTGKLRDDAERFRILADMAPMLIRTTDADGDHCWLNQTWLNHTGQAQSSTGRCDWLEAVHPEERERLARQYALHLEARVPMNAEYRLRGRDGSYRWFADRTVPVYRSDGTYGGLVSSCIDITEPRQNAEQQQRLLEENRELVASVFRVIEHERQRIARDLHDDIGQWITAIRANNLVVRSCLPEDAGEAVHQAVTAIDQCAASLHDAVRKMLHELRPSHLDTLGLRDGLRELVDQWQRAFPAIACQLAVADGILDAPDEIRTTLYRVVQESLTNVAKHAAASQVSIHLGIGAAADGLAEALVVTVEDNGAGGAGSGTNIAGLGLVGMRERVLAVRGEFSIRSLPGCGTRIRAEIPLPQSASLSLPSDYEPSVP